MSDLSRELRAPKHFDRDYTSWIRWRDYAKSLEARLLAKADAAEGLAEALHRIGHEMPTSERNPDGDEQAAHSMQLVAQEALACFRVQEAE